MKYKSVVLLGVIVLLGLVIAQVGAVSAQDLTPPSALALAKDG